MKTLNLFLVALTILLSQTANAQSDCTNDTTAPIAICIDGIAVNIEDGETATLWPADFDEGSHDDCSEVSLSFEDGQESISVDANTASPMPVVLYVTDESGNQSSCWGNLIINDNFCIDDTEAPIAICDADVLVLLNAENMATIDVSNIDDGSYDNCSEVILSFAQTAIITTMTVDENTETPMNVTLFVTDAEGQQNFCFTTLTIETQDCNNDTVLPIPYCKAGVVVTLNEDGVTAVFASDFDAGSFDNCSPNLQASFSEDTNDNTLSLTQTNLGIMDVTIWITDDSGNQDFCTTFLEVVDFGHLADLSGNVVTELGTGIPGATVQARLVGSNAVVAEATTGTDGNYTLSGLDENASYELSVEREGGDINGVTTFDLVMIRRHIVGITPLPSPLRIMAADVNNSNTITTFDMVVIRRLILAIAPTFENSSSWKFFRSTIQFSDPQNPFDLGVVTGNDFTIDIAANNGAAVNFIGIKTGDVNGSANP